jgi:2-polyprenyl-6-methoxyphenol hydroxylase-like FAD-dependent oxidoreductase
MSGAAAAGLLAFPVIIVGGGPVGMVLALTLDSLGVASVIVNSEPRPRQHPKGGTHNSRTMEHYRRLGLSVELRRLGLPPDHPTDVVYVTRINGYELQRIEMPSEREKMRAVAQAGPTDQVPEPILRVNQMQVEAHVFASLDKRPHITRRYGWQCMRFAEDRDGVSAEIEEIATGRREHLRGAYLAGCDGGQGIVRRSLGVHYVGDQPERQAYLGGPMVSTYMRSAELFAGLKRKPAWQYWFINRELRANIVCVDGKVEFLFSTRLDSEDEKPDTGLISRAFRASAGQNVAFEIVGHMTWTAGQAFVADSFGHGRVMLAGDSVHLFTPTGGFGVNTGVDDAVNLGWKLAALVQGWGGPRLVDSYEIERRPIALRNTAAAKQLARNVGAVPVGEAIEQDSSQGEADRRAATEFLAAFGEEFGSLGVQLGARYDGSPIVIPAGVPPPDNPITYTPSSVPGGRAPHLWLDDRTSLYDHLGKCFTLLHFAGEHAEVRALEEAAHRRGVPLTVLEIGHAPGRDLYDCALALIRPDQHVAWRGNRLPDDCDALIRRVTGW